jgi:hypothetical protein
VLSASPSKPGTNLGRTALVSSFAPVSLADRRKIARQKFGFAGG